MPTLTTFVTFQYRVCTNICGTVPVSVSVPCKASVTLWHLYSSHSKTHLSSVSHLWHLCSVTAKHICHLWVICDICTAVTAKHIYHLWVICDICTAVTEKHICYLWFICDICTAVTAKHICYLWFICDICTAVTLEHNCHLWVTCDICTAVTLEHNCHLWVTCDICTAVTLEHNCHLWVICFMVSTKWHLSSHSRVLFSNQQIPLIKDRRKFLPSVNLQFKFVNIFPIHKNHQWEELCWHDIKTFLSFEQNDPFSSVVMSFVFFSLYFG